MKLYLILGLICISFTACDVEHLFMYHLGLTMQYENIRANPTEITVRGTSLVVQWLRICPAMQETQVQSLVMELRSHVP